MSLPRTATHHRLVRHPSVFRALYVSVLLFSFHWSLVAYVNSTYLSQFVSTQVIGVLYTLGAIITIIAFFLTARVLRTRGNYRLAFELAVTEGVLLLGLAIAPSVYIAVPLFVLHHALIPLILFTIDIFTEGHIGAKEGMTGRKRGMELAFVSLGYALAILTAGLLLGSGTPRFSLVYVVSALCIFTFAYHIRKQFNGFPDQKYQQINVFGVLHTFLFKHDFRFVFLCHFLLQFFFCWMVIYVPLYLATILGFSWDKIGLILFVGLLAYVFLEYPIGVIADRYIGEKEMMAAGFMILAITTIYLAFLKTPLLAPWLVTMFMTRVGASLVEVTTESYFFKHIQERDANIISFFRASNPLAYVSGALVGSLSLIVIPFNYLFVLLGILMIPGIVFALLLKDTR